MARIPITITIDKELAEQIHTEKGRMSERYNDLLHKGLLYEAQEAGLSIRQRMQRSIKGLVSCYRELYENTHVVDKDIHEEQPV